MDAKLHPNIAWDMVGAKFRFTDHAEYAKWGNGRPVWFSFDPQYTDDAGKSIFLRPQLAELYVPITDKNGLLEFNLEEDGPVISARVTFYAPLVPGVDQQMLDEWVREKGGWSSARLDIDSDDARLLHDRGVEWTLLAA